MVRALLQRQAEAWNHHDAKAHADLFTENCDLAKVAGHWWNGRTELERELHAVYAAVFADLTHLPASVPLRQCPSHALLR